MDCFLWRAPSPAVRFLWSFCGACWKKKKKKCSERDSGFWTHVHKVSVLGQSWRAAACRWAGGGQGLAERRGPGKYGCPVAGAGGREEKVGLLVSASRLMRFCWERRIQTSRAREGRLGWTLCPEGAVGNRRSVRSGGMAARWPSHSCPAVGF